MTNAVEKVAFLAVLSADLYRRLCRGLAQLAEGLQMLRARRSRLLYGEILYLGPRGGRRLRFRLGKFIFFVILFNEVAHADAILNLEFGRHWGQELVRASFFTGLDGSLVPLSCR